MAALKKGEAGGEGRRLGDDGEKQNVREKIGGTAYVAINEVQLVFSPNLNPVRPIQTQQR